MAKSKTPRHLRGGIMTQCELALLAVSVMCAAVLKYKLLLDVAKEIDKFWEGKE